LKKKLRMRGGKRLLVVRVCGKVREVGVPVDAKDDQSRLPVAGGEKSKIRLSGWTKLSHGVVEKTGGQGLWAQRPKLNARRIGINYKVMRGKKSDSKRGDTREVTRAVALSG